MQKNTIKKKRGIKKMMSCEYVIVQDEVKLFLPVKISQTDETIMQEICRKKRQKRARS